MTTPAEAPAVDLRPRWRGGFGRLWSAAVLSRLGDAIRNVALPLLAVGLTTSPIALSMVSAAGYLPWLLFGLVGGAIADRVDRRRAMWIVDVVRAALVGAFAVGVALGEAHLAVLALLAFALTTLQTLFDNAATAILPTIVSPGALPVANARLLTGQSLAGTFIGAPIAGVLVAASFAVPFGVNALTYLAAAALVASLPRPSTLPPAPGGSGLRADIADGVRRLWSDRLLRGICVANLLANTVIGGLTALLVLIVTRWIGAGEQAFALVLAGYGAGAVAGGLLAAPIGRRVGAARVLVGVLVVQAGCLAVIGSVAHVVAAGVGLALFGACGLIFNVHAVTLAQQRLPGAYLGRVSAAQRTLGVAGAPVGALLAGALAEATEVNIPALAGAGLVATAALVMIHAVRS